MPKSKSTGNRYIKPSFKKVAQITYISVADKFKLPADAPPITSRYLMGFLVKHWNDEHGKNYNMEDFRVKEIKNETNKPTDTAPAEPTPPAQTT